MIPVLSLIFLTPIAGAVLILLLKPERRAEARMIAAACTLASLLLSAFVYAGYAGDMGAINAALNPEPPAPREGPSPEEIFRMPLEERLALPEAEPAEDAPEDPTPGFCEECFRYEERADWINAGPIRIGYHVGVDGLSAPMLLLTGLASFCGVLISWKVEDRVREFMAFFLLLTAGVYGVFMALDAFLLFFCYEMTIFPMYILIRAWGWKETRQYASMKLTLYIFAGSVVALVGVLAMVFLGGKAAGVYSFDLFDMARASAEGAYDGRIVAGVPAVTLAKFVFPFVFLGFGVLAGIFPFHNWSPDGHVAAPTAVSMMHAGVLMKIGAYSAFRIAITLLPEGARAHLPWIVLLALINVLYGALIALRQRDLKYVIGFSSVSHMGLVIMGWATMNVTGLTGAGLQMFSHGVMTALFFACVGVIYDRTHTRDIPSMGGLLRPLPLTALAFLIGGLASMGMPGLSGFMAEIPILIGMWNADHALLAGEWAVRGHYALAAIAAGLGIVITAAYIFRAVQAVFLGDGPTEDIPPSSSLDRFALIVLALTLIALGIFPQIMAPLIESAVTPAARLLGGF